MPRYNITLVVAPAYATASVSALYWRGLTAVAADLLNYDKEHEQGNDNNDNDDNDHGLFFFAGRGTAMYVVTL